MHYFETKNALKYGLTEAILLSYIEKTNSYSITQKDCYIEDICYACITLQEFYSTFPFITEDIINSCLDGLISNNIIERANNDYYRIRGAL